MIKIPTISEEELKYYENKQVIIERFTNHSIQLFEILTFYNIRIVAFYSEEDNSLLKMHYKGIPILKKNNIISFVKTHTGVVFQFWKDENRVDSIIKAELRELNVCFSKLNTSQIVASFAPLTYIQYCKKQKYYNKLSKEWLKTCKCKKIGANIYHFVLRKSPLPIILCMPMKTADFTLIDTFNEINKNEVLNYKNFAHSPNHINMRIASSKRQKIKIITAVREPIIQNLSSLYQGISDGYFYKNWILRTLENKNMEGRMRSLEEFENMFLENREVQTLWNEYVECFIYNNERTLKNSDIIRPIQSFIPEFNEKIFNIYEFDFDKNSGYSILKKENMEVFVYQLEKLNSIVPKLSEWIGIPFDKLNKSNIGEDKWTGESYKQAQNEIIITQEYFDRCFNEPYVQHCYSEEDIEKFKSRWASHIQKTDNRII